MRKSFLLTSGVVTLLLISAFTINPSQRNKTTERIEPTMFKLMEVAYLWELLEDTYDPDRDRDDTWLDVGFRSKYAMAKNYASIGMIEEVFGTKVFIRGPHGDDMDFNSNTSFGYYNPEFIAQLHTIIEATLANPTYKVIAQNLYQQHLKGMAHAYHKGYKYLHSKEGNLPYLKTEYLMGITSPKGIDTGSFQEAFRGFAEGIEKSDGLDVYEGFTAPAFWLRRSIDGTDKQLFDLLEMVMSKLEEKDK